MPAPARGDGSSRGPRPPPGVAGYNQGFRGCLSLGAKGDGAGRGLGASPCPAHFTDGETEQPSRLLGSIGTAGLTGRPGGLFPGG